MKFKRQYELNLFAKGWKMIMYLTHFANENFSLLRIKILYGNSDGMQIRIASDECYKHKIATLKNFIEMRQTTLNDPKFDIQILLCE